VTGHPDDQAYASWRGPDFAASSGFPLSNGNPFQTQGFITNFASFAIFCAPTNPGGATVVVNFYTDDTLTIPVGGFSWAVPNGTLLHNVIPGLGNFVVIHITTTDAAANTMQIAVYPTNTPVGAPSYSGPANYVQGFNVNVAASSTVTALLPYVAAGKGYIFLADRLSTAHLTGRIVTVRADGTSQARLVDWNTLTPFQSQEFVAPGQALRVEVDNTDGAASHQVNYFCSVDGR
jgi:hypothetical protein